MEVIHYSVVVHHCLLGPQISEEEIEPNWRYVLVGRTKEGVNQYRRLPKKCRCRKRNTKFLADLATNYGEAQIIFKKKEEKIIPADDQIWSRFWTDKKSKIARIDLITRADIERAYISLRKESAIMIEEIHKMQVAARTALIVPFRPDPQEGRVLFPFGPDERTVGGHAPAV